ncbi:MAG: YhcH/YjgK/YiaL family protein [Bacteroidetes bacterium]|nr:YhcH/YjgK/YiaL family protein [Bacteroidota bacterium]
MRRIIILFFIACAFGLPSASAQTDTAWTQEKAARWFMSMDWFKEGKKKYDAFGRELEDESTNFQPGSPVNMIEFARQYHANPSRWQKAFDYLKHTDFSTVEPGRHAIDGDDVYAVITLGPPKVMDDTTTWESHRNYEDIHYVIDGKERLGIIPLSEAKVVNKYDPAHDLAGYSATGKYYVATPGLFFIITTEEAHRPGIREEGCDKVKKLFIKVRKS